MEDLLLYQSILAMWQDGRSAVLVTVVDSSGSTPWKAGGKMLVRDDRSTVGTVGGGRVKAEMVAAATEILQEGRPRLQEYLLDEHFGRDTL